jgi:hypothetical protein
MTQRREPENPNFEYNPCVYISTILWLGARRYRKISVGRTDGVEVSAQPHHPWLSSCTPTSMTSYRNSSNRKSACPWQQHVTLGMDMTQESVIIHLRYCTNSNAAKLGTGSDAEHRTNTLVSWYRIHTPICSEIMYVDLLNS